MDPAIKRVAAGGFALLLTILPTTLARAAVPTITSFTPASGPVGTVVTINGTGFTGGVGVNFNGISSSSFAFLNDTQAQASVPPGATTGPIIVVTPAGTAISLANFSVTSTGPSSVDCAANPSALQPAIDAASIGSTLIVSGTCVGTFTVARNLTLRGTLATLDAQGSGTVLTVSAGIVKVVGLTLTGGTGNADVCPPFGCFDGGGIIIALDSTLALVRSTVSGNTANFGGGAILNGGTLSIERSTVSGNSASDSGGGILNWGALTMKRSTVNGNTARVGGGIYNLNRGGPYVGTLTVSDSRVSGNSANFGGGIFNVGTLIVSDSTVSGNSALNGNGGGIFNDVLLTLTRSVVSRNSASNGAGVLNVGGNVTVSQSTVRGNMASFDGGGFFNESGQLTITASTLSGNSASDPNGGGGGIYNGSTPGSTVSITNSTLSRNSATFGGGIINVGSLTVASSTLSANSASSGGGIFNGNAGPITGSSILSATIDAANRGGDCSGFGTATSNGYNLVGADCAFSSIGDRTVADTAHAIGIGPLAYHGGPTSTMALFARSRAKDAIPIGAIATDGVTPLCPSSGTTDQRGVPRPQGAACDVGAYERIAPAAPPIVDQSFTSPSDLTSVINECCRFIAQTFTAGLTGTLTGINIDVESTTSFPLRVAIRMVDNGVPGATVLGSVILTSNDAPLSRLITFPQTIHVSAGVQYAIVVDYPSAPPPPGGLGGWNGATGDAYPQGDTFGSLLDGLSWPVGSGQGFDLHFRTYVRV